jgi:propanediol dehydratase small subunit
MGREWKRVFPAASAKDIRRFLAIFSDAFAFRSRNRLSFSPHDKVMDVYKAIYSSKWMADQLEVERLALGLEDEFKRKFPDELMTEDTTLGMLFEQMTGNVRLHSQSAKN